MTMKRKKSDSGMHIDKTREEILDELNKTYASTDENVSVFPGMSYEEGVQAALEWILGDAVEPPMEG